MLNRVELIGRIVNDLKTNVLSNGNEVLYFTIAVSKRTGKEEKTTFIPVKAFDNKAVYISKYFKKGDLIFLEAELNVSNTKKDDEFITYWSVIVKNIKKLATPSKSVTEEIKVPSKDIDKKVDVDSKLDAILSDEQEDEKPWELDF